VSEFHSAASEEVNLYIQLQMKPFTMDFGIPSLRAVCENKMKNGIIKIQLSYVRAGNIHLRFPPKTILFYYYCSNKKMRQKSRHTTVTAVLLKHKSRIRSGDNIKRPGKTAGNRAFSVH